MLYFKRKKKKVIKKKKIPKKKKVVKKKKKAIKKRSLKKAAGISRGKEAPIGKVTHYFPQVRAGAIIIKKGKVAIGDILRIKGHTTDFKQKVKSIQIERVPVEEASAGEEIGVLMRSRVRINDLVYKVIK